MRNKNYPLYDVKPFTSIRQMLDMAKQEAGNKIAYKYRASESEIAQVTYSQFVDTTRQLGQGLYLKNAASGHIAMLGENSYKWICTYLCALQSDGVFIPVDKELPHGDIIHILTEGECSVLFYSEAYEDFLRESRESLPNVKYFVGLNRDSDDGDFLSFDKLVADGAASLERGEDGFDKLQSDPYEMKMLIYTSGTTGMAKGVMLSEHNLVSSVYYGLQVSTVFDTGLSVLPYNHTYEAVSGILVSIHKHTTVCINENLRAVLKNFKTYKPAYVYLVPAFAELFYKKIWSEAENKGIAEKLRKGIKTSDKLRKMGIDMRRKLFSAIHETFGGNLKKIVCGGAPIRPEIGAFFDSIGINLINGYGITECSPLVSANRDYFNDCSTVGVPLPCCSIRIDQPSADGIGEICVKGDVVMMGYYKNPEQTAKVLQDGWFYTGDYGKMNDKGQLLITGRKKNLIVLQNGKNIFPEEIEQYIATIPYVKEVIVYALKNADGEDIRLCAEIYCDPDAVAGKDPGQITQMLKDDISAACAQLPSYKRVTKVVLRSAEFKKTTTNKIKRNEINGYRESGE